MTKKINLKDLFQRSITLTEWYEQLWLNKDYVAQIRAEDVTKKHRLEALNKLIGLPYDKTYTFEHFKANTKNLEIDKYLSEKIGKKCAVQLIPYDLRYRNFRMRGLSYEEALKWAGEQNLGGKDYKITFTQHSDKTLWSVIFIIRNRTVYGELIKGPHFQLTQGIYKSFKPRLFYSELNKDIKLKNKELIRAISMLKVTNPRTQQRLKKQLNASFSEDFISGYFEAVFTEESGLSFVDYNRLLTDTYTDISIARSPKVVGYSTLSGNPASPGKVNGLAVLVKDPKELESVDFTANIIIFCEYTSPSYIPYLRKVKAIVTQKGGILSHASIIARELKIPCIVGVGNALKHINTGDVVSVDAFKGVIMIINRNRS